MPRRSFPYRIQTTTAVRRFIPPAGEFALITAAALSSSIYVPAATRLVPKETFFPEFGKIDSFRGQEKKLAADVQRRGGQGFLWKTD
jgi:hypothetical protein